MSLYPSCWLFLNVRCPVEVEKAIERPRLCGQRHRLKRPSEPGNLLGETKRSAAFIYMQMCSLKKLMREETASQLSTLSTCVTPTASILIGLWIKSCGDYSLRSSINSDPGDLTVSLDWKCFLWTVPLRFSAGVSFKRAITELFWLEVSNTV